MRDSTEALSTVTYEITILWLLYLCAPFGFSLTELPPRSYSKWLPKAWLGCVDIRVRVKGVNTYTYIGIKHQASPTIDQELSGKLYTSYSLVTIAHVKVQKVTQPSNTTR